MKENIESAMEVDCDEWKLDPDVNQLVYNNAPVDDILYAWAHAYGEVKPHPRVANCRSACVNLLVCFAVHYEHKNLVEKLIDLCSPFCKFCPHITAMDNHNLKMEELLHAILDRGLMFGPVCPSKKGYGCIKENAINVGQEISVLDILLKWDDQEALDYVFKYYKSFFPPLADMARLHNSKKCLKYIKENDCYCSC